MQVVLADPQVSKHTYYNMQHLSVCIKHNWRAELVVQLARFSISPFYDFTPRCYRKSLQFHVHRVSRMRKYISLRSSVYTIYSWQVCALLVVGLRFVVVGLHIHKQPVLQSSRFVSTPPSFFCLTLLGSLPLANNIPHSASIIILCGCLLPAG